MAEEFNNARLLECKGRNNIGETDLLLNNYIRKYTVICTQRAVVYILKRNDFKSMMTLFKSELDDLSKRAKQRSEFLANEHNRIEKANKNLQNKTGRGSLVRFDSIKGNTNAFRNKFFPTTDAGTTHLTKKR